MPCHDAAVHLDLLDWRRRVTALYAEVRSTAEPRVAHERWRATRDTLLGTHPQSPIPESEREWFTGVPVAPYDPVFRFEAALDVDVEPCRLEVPTGTDGVVRLDRIGRVHLPGLGSLDAWWVAGYGGGLFLPVRDATSGVTTYGGGRYILDTIKGADLGGREGRLVIDLNFAYNPSCAYDPMWACPLAPSGNVLTGAVSAGELVAANADRTTCEMP